jgi:hypothetical protein
VFHGVERLVEGIDLLDAEAFQDLRQDAIDGGNALDQSISLSGIRVRRGSADGATQIVDDLQQLAGKAGDRVLPGVLRAPFTLTLVFSVSASARINRSRKAAISDAGSSSLLSRATDGSTSSSIVFAAMSYAHVAVLRRRKISLHEAFWLRGSTSSNSASTTSSLEEPLLPPSDDPACPPALAT